jgi:Tfp pilus assembly protein PilF
MAKQFPIKKEVPNLIPKSIVYLIPAATAEEAEAFQSKISGFGESLKNQTLIKFLVTEADVAQAKELLENKTYHYACWVHSGNLDILPTVHQSFMQQRNLKAGLIHCADAHHQTEGKKAPKKSFWTRIVHATQKLLTPMRTGHTESGYFVTDADTALEILEKPSIWKCRIDYDFPYRLKLHGYHISYFSLNTGKDDSPKASILKVKWSALSNRWYWFITEPMNVFRGKTMSEHTPWDGRHPVYRFLFAVFFMLAMVLMPVLSFDYSVTWDEYEDIGYFSEVLSYFKTFGEDKRCLDIEGELDHSESGVNKNLIPHLVNYGPFVNLLQAAVNEYISPFGLYETRHIIITLFALWGMLFTGLIARKLGNWKTALLALLFIWLTPTIFGHSMNNQKDIPFLAFYISSVFYVIRLLDELPKPSFKTLFMLAVTMGITMSIRVGGLLVFAYLGLFVGLHFLLRVWKKEIKFSFSEIRSYAWPLIVVYFFAYVIGIMFWPAALADPLKHPLTALKNFESFSLVHIYEIFEGKRYYMKDFPAHYIPKSMLITIPLFVLAGLVLLVLGSPKILKKYDWQKIGILVFVFAFPIAYVIYKKSAVYSSWRHLLFAYPAIVVLAAVGWDWLSDAFKQKFLKIGVYVVLLGLIGNVTFWMVKNHPYQYVYYNEIVGGVNGAYGNYETDYWCQSPRGAIEWLMKNKPEIMKKKTTVVSNNESHSMSYYAQKQTDSIEIGWARDHEWNKNMWEYAIWTTRTLSKTQMKNGFFPPKGTIHVIKVDDIPLAAIVKRENFDLAYGELMTKNRNMDSAVTLFRNYTKYDPLEEEAFRGWGLALLQAGRTDESFAPLYKSIELCPENYFSWNFLGFAYRQKTNNDSALICFNKTIEYKTNMSLAYDGRGDIYFGKGDFNAAQKDYESAINYGGGSYLVYYKMGESFLNLGNYEEALKYYGAALQAKPDFAEVNYRVGQVLEKTGRKDAAQQYYQKARELGLQ